MIIVRKSVEVTVHRRQLKNKLLTNNKILILYVPLVIPMHTVAPDCPIRPAKGGFSEDFQLSFSK
jgi:hypothetical protein